MTDRIDLGRSGRIKHMGQVERAQCLVCHLDVLPGDNVYLVGKRVAKTQLILDTGDCVDLEHMVPTMRHDYCQPPPKAA